MKEEEEIKNKLLEEEKEQSLNYKKDLEERLTRRAELRTKNLLAAKDRQELDTSKLDSSLKKNTAFIKKMRNMTESQQTTLEKELLCLNLSKYVSELAQAVVETRLKMADVATAVHLCSLLHQRYQDFSSMLLQNWQKMFTGKKDEKITNMSKLRVDLRLYAELISSGIFTQKDGLPLLGNVLTTLVNSDKEEHQNIAVILSFCRHCGDDYMGLTPRKFRLASEKFGVNLPKSDFLPAERQKNVRSLMKEYFSTLIKHLFRDHKELQKAEQQNMRILQTRGELTEDRKSLTENLSASLSKLLSNSNILADLLDEDLPEMPSLKSNEEEESLVEGFVGEGEKGEGFSQNIWEDEDSKAFYTSLPQLKALLPSILYSESEKPTTTPVTENVEDADTQEELLDENLEETEIKKEEEGDEEALPPELPTEEEGEDPGSNSNRVLLDGFLNSLPNCISRDLIDSAALEFCLKLNTKPCRKRLVKSIFLVPRTRLDLLPFYSRLVGTLQPLMPDLATDLVSMLKLDFRYQVKKKDQINIESKIKVVRFIGELTKFGIFPRSETLICLRLLLHDFNHHHIEMACNLLETCGRYLYRSSDSHHRTKIFLEQMMRKKTVKAFDPRYNTMIENAYYYVNPPEVTNDASRAERPPMQQYIRHLLYTSLCKTNTERILRQIRKLHWEDREISLYAVKCLTSVWNAKFYNIRCIANLLAGLIAHYDWVGTAVVDGTLEDIRFGMETNEPKFNQRRVAAIKYLGELYNYRVIESSVIFKILYSLITFGVSWDPGNPSTYDAPDHHMRLRLVCTLLDTCGQFFSSGASKRRLDCYLTYFQHYFWFKKSVYSEEEFPWQVDHLVQDTIVGVRPKITMFKSLEESQNAVTALNKQIVDKAIQNMPSLKQYFGNTDEENEEKALPTIPEGDDHIEGEEDAMEDDFVEVDDEEEELERLPRVKAGEEEEEEGGEEWSEGHGGESLTPSQHSQPSRLNVEGETEANNTGPESGEVKSEGESQNISFTLKQVHCQEDEDFMSEFDRMLADNLLERTRETPRPAHSHISVPVHVKSSAKKTYDQLVSEGVEEEPSKPVVNFILLTRAGNKQQFTNVEMPVNSDLVMKLRTREEAEKMERDKVKQLTLEINERQEEEEAFELMQQGQRPALQNLNRDRRPRYQHPRGVPDADLIFGSKKAR
ncbi:Regulator of nonsense transcripts 2 [Armadillidium nasatum]|uniref:Regulator of nonsense transcripts 2 n=1 Tax=Armadillidium nasatum TaxID=96803 RepID=A0A5N5SJG4_9CRUS|nr:Regulator of nonsense transcripts 2 [Armadillidium nasatum]